MAETPDFEELVTSEAAIRADYIYRRGHFTFGSGGERVHYNARNPDQGDNKVLVSDHLFEHFVRTYNYMFKDSSQHGKVEGSMVFNTENIPPHEIEVLARAIDEFVERNYDDAGNPILRNDQVPDELARLYDHITQHVLLNKAGMALGVMFSELGRGEKWQAITPRGIDFSRGEPTEDLKQRIEDAMHAPDPVVETSHFQPNPESFEVIAGMRFPVKKDVNRWKTHLVTQNGYLVDLTDELRHDLEEHLKAGHALEDFHVDVGVESFHLHQFQQKITGESEPAREARKALKRKLKDMAVSDIFDGEQVKPEGVAAHQASFVSMDVDSMTGLHKIDTGQGSELDRFKTFLGECGYEKLTDLLPADYQENITAMADETVKENARGKLRGHIQQTLSQIRRAAEGDEMMQALIDRAGKHLEVSLPRLYEIADQPFLKGEPPEVKTSGNDSPHMYLTMGGSASGKGGLKKLAKKECEDDLVVGSLDDARYESDRYWLDVATNNHNYDYTAVDEFAKGLREIVTKRAINGKFNYFLDGSGIPYENRNDKTVRQFKDEGYDVSILAAQAPLYLDDPAKRQALSAVGQQPDDALARLGSRQENDLRGMPPHLMVAKHVGLALASRNAARDKYVDRYMTEDVTGPVGSSYTLSYTVESDHDTVQALTKLHGVDLKQALEAHHLVPDWVRPPQGDTPEGNGEFYDIKVIRKNGDDSYRIEVITDMRQYVNMVHKGLLNRDAIGPEECFKHTMHCDIEGHLKGVGGKLHITQPIGLGETEWEPFHAVSTSHQPSASIDTGSGAAPNR